MKKNIQICRNCKYFCETVTTRLRQSTTRMGCAFDNYGGSEFDEDGKVIGEWGSNDILEEEYIEYDLPNKCPYKLEHMLIK